MSRILSLISFFTFSSACLCQNTIGLPEITNYHKQTYKGGSQNWDIAQGKNGIMYFANNEGLLSFDGTYWKLHPLPNKTIVRSLLISDDGKIYTGGQDELGYFLPDKTGKLIYHSIKDLIPLKHRSFTDVWDIVCLGDDFFFRTTEKIFHLSKEAISIYKTDNWLFLGENNGEVIAQDFHRGLLRFKKGQWLPVDNSGFNSPNILITASLPFDTGASLITTLKHGIFLLKNDRLEKFESSALKKNPDYHIYAATIINEEHIALATTSHGCIIIDRSGNQVQYFSRNNGLQKNSVLFACADKNKNLWLALDNGIDFIAYNSAIKNIFPDKQNEGAGYSAIIHNNNFYVATTNGLYYVPLYKTEDLSFVKGDFYPVEHTTGQVWNVSEVNGKLLAGHHEGAFIVEGNKARNIDNSSGYWSFLPYSAIQPSRIMVAGTYFGIKFYNYETGRFSHLPSDANFESSRFVSIVDDEIWVSHPYKGVFKVTWKENQPTEIYSYSKGSDPLPRNGNYIFKIKNRLVAATETGIYEYNRSKDLFEPAADLQQIFGNKAIRYMKEDPSGNVWFVYDKNLAVADFSTPQPTIIYITELNRKMVSGFEQVYPVDSNNVFVGSEKGYFHINYYKYKETHPGVSVQISEVWAIGKTDSLLFGGYSGFTEGSQQQTYKPSIPYNWNSFHFEFSSPLYEQQANIEYSCYLKGYDKKWGEWTDKTEKEYTYLPAGSYEFQVKARNNFKNESVIYSYYFVVKPPWYQTWWAYVLYSLAFVYGLYLVYRWQKKKFIRQKQQYEEEQKNIQYRYQLELEKNEKEIMALRNEKLEAEIQHKNKEMASATMHLVKKGEMLAKMKDELQRLSKNENNEQSLDSLKKMIKTLGEEEKMDKDWEHFTIHFDKVHNDFFIALKEKHPNLSANEMKLCAYLRMNLSTKEMAQLMNISVRGVEISRYRLRKKLSIPTETNLFTYLLDFHSPVKPINQN